MLKDMSPTVTLTFHASKYRDVSPVEFMYFVFTCMLGESHYR